MPGARNPREQGGTGDAGRVTGSVADRRRRLSRRGRKASGSNSMVQELGELFGVATPVPEVTITKTLVASTSADDLEKREEGAKGGERNARTKE